MDFDLAGVDKLITASELLHKLNIGSHNTVQTKREV
jgi:hypothetical protein